MSDLVKAAEAAKAQSAAAEAARRANGTVGRVYTDAWLAQQKREAEERAQKREQERRDRIRQDMEAEQARRNAKGEKIWADHEARIKAAQDRVTEAEQALDRAREAAWKAEDEVRGLFDDLNGLRSTQDFVQDSAGVAISAAGLVASGGLGTFLILAGLGVTNDLLRPGLTDFSGPVNKPLLDASQGLYNDAVGELAEQSGRAVAGKIIGAGDLVKDVLELGDPAALYEINLSDFASARDVQRVRDLFQNADPRGLAERGFGPSKQEIDTKLQNWQNKLKQKEKAEADLANRQRELEQARNARHREYSACVHGGRC